MPDQDKRSTWIVMGCTAAFVASIALDVVRAAGFSPAHVAGFALAAAGMIGVTLATEMFVNEKRQTKR